MLLKFASLTLFIEIYFLSLYLKRMPVDLLKQQIVVTIKQEQVFSYLRC